LSPAVTSLAAAQVAEPASRPAGKLNQESYSGKPTFWAMRVSF
jgi:hypothetical protein